jgi:hypothetical protein
MPDFPDFGYIHFIFVNRFQISVSVPRAVTYRQESSDTDAIVSILKFRFKKRSIIDQSNPR